MSHFCLLAEPENYVAIRWDLLADEAARAYWLEHFDKHFGEMLHHASVQYGRTATRQIAAARQQFADVIAALRANPASLPSGQLTILELCRQREKVLRANRLNDPFGHIKQRENVSAAKLYPTVVRGLHARGGDEKWLRLIESVLAGNIFDLGSASTMHLAAEGTDFGAAVEKLPPRPWRVDDFDRLAQDMPASPPTKWGKAVIFVDNAGADFILGVMPLARELALCGTRVVLAANELPSLNDITVNEMIPVVESLAARDADLQALIEAGMFEVVSSGNDVPLIDLSSVSDELNAASADADLVVLVGMGRAVESNFDAKFKADTLRLALLKDQAVAQRVGGKLFDVVCKYTPAGT